MEQQQKVSGSIEGILTVVESRATLTHADDFKRREYEVWRNSLIAEYNQLDADGQELFRETLKGMLKASMSEFMEGTRELNMFRAQVISECLTIAKYHGVAA